jgi:F-type H+-transporting ATPase subunit b
MEHNLIAENLAIFAIQVGVFIFMVTILWKAAWKPFKTFVANRQDSISKALQQAEEAKRMVAKLEQDYQVQVRAIQEKTSQALAEAKAEAGKVRDDILRQAHEEALAMRAKNLSQIEEERRVVIRELRADISRLSVSIAEKIVERTIDASTQEKFIGDILSRINEKNISSEGVAS